MDVKDYCRSIEIDLYGWKAKMYDMVRKVDKLKSADKEKLRSRIEDLHSHIADMEHLIEQLQTECPAEFGPQKKQVAERTEDLRKKYEDAMSAVLLF